MSNVVEKLNTLKQQTGLVNINENINERRYNIQNLKPIKPGEVRNPNGKPKGKLNYETIRKIAIENMGKKEGKTPLQIEAELVEVALQEAKDANFQFYKDDKDRVHGQAVSRTEIGGLEDANPIKLELGISRILDKNYNDSPGEIH